MFQQQQIILARNTNLFDFLSQRGYSLTSENKQFRLNGYDGLLVDHNRWFQHSTGLGGNPIDLLMMLENMNFRDAVNVLLNLNQKHHSGYDGFDYLTKNRKIDPDLVNDLLALELIKIENEKVFFIGYENQMHLQNKGAAKCISWRSIIDHKRGEKKGADKYFSFAIPDYNNHSNSRTIILTESPIDALSIACLEIRKSQKDFYQTYKIALCGTHQKNIYDRIKKLKPNKIFLALDNDHAGHNAMKILAQKLSPITSTTHVIYHAKDPNDLLLKINQPKPS